MNATSTTIKERPIFFKGPAAIQSQQINALQQGWKTQHRWVIKPQPEVHMVGNSRLYAWKGDAHYYAMVSQPMGLHQRPRLLE